MKFNKIQILFFIFIISCAPYSNTLNLKEPYNARGIAYVYNDYDYNQKIIKSRMNNDIMQISNQNLKTGSLLKITNPINKKSLVLKNIKRIKYPDFYKLLITKPVADKLDLDLKLPILEITEIRKNKSFIAQKAKIYNEEKKISSKAPVASVQISNISKNKGNKKNVKKVSDKIYIHVATFYSMNTARFLKNRIIEDLVEIDNQKIIIKKINSKKTQVILGPYKSVNLLKNDYIVLNKYGFEELDIFINE